MPTAIFTICAKNYLAQARVLMDSLRRHEPAAERILVLSDRLDGAFDRAAEDFTVIEAAELGIAELAAMAFRYDIMELATAIKPSAFRHLLERRGYRRAVYLDPDIRLYAPLAPVWEALDGGAGSALTPHALAPLPGTRQLGDQSFLQSGVYNLGFLAAAASPEVLAALAWWEGRLVRHCRRTHLADGEFVDQKWMELWPLHCPAAAILRHPGLNVAYWNLDQRPLSQVAGTWMAGEAPLIFLHFSGLKAGPPLVVSSHRSELQESALGAGARLFHDYVRALRAAGLETAGAWPYAFAGFADGSPIPFALRRAFRERLEPFAGDPFRSRAAIEAALRGGAAVSAAVSRGAA